MHEETAEHLKGMSSFRMDRLTNVTWKLLPIVGAFLIGASFVALVGDGFLLRKLAGLIFDGASREILESRDYVSTKNEKIFAYKGQWRQLNNRTEFNQFNGVYSLSKTFGDLWIGPAVKSPNPDFLEKILNHLDKENYFYLVYTVVFDDRVFYAVEGFSHDRIDRLPVESVIAHEELNFFGADFRMLVHFPQFYEK